MTGYVLKRADGRYEESNRSRDMAWTSALGQSQFWSDTEWARAQRADILRLHGVDTVVGSVEAEWLPGTMRERNGDRWQAVRETGATT